MKRATAVCFQRSEEALSRRIGADVLVTMPTDGELHELSGGATAIWEELREPRTALDLVGRLATAFAAPSTGFAAQVEECLNSLLRLGVVEEVPDVDG